MVKMPNDIREGSRIRKLPQTPTYCGQNSPMHNTYSKKISGTTLVELIITVCMLAILTLSVLGLFSAALKMNMISRTNTLHTYMAQLQIEELYGLDQDTFVDKVKEVDGLGGKPSTTVNGYPVRVKWNIVSNAIGDTNYMQLADPNNINGGTVSELIDLRQITILIYKRYSDASVNVGTIDATGKGPVGDGYEGSPEHAARYGNSIFHISTVIRTTPSPPTT